MTDRPIKSPYQQPQGLFDDREMKILQVFKNNESLAKLLRKVFWQDELSTNEAKAIKDSVTPELYTIIRRCMQPVLDHNAPLFAMPSRWVKYKFADMLASEVKPLVLATQDSITFVEEGLKRLEKIMNGEDKCYLSYVDIRMTRNYEDMSAEDVKRHAVAMHESLSQVESILYSLYMHGNMEIETPEQEKEREKKDSTR